MRKILITGAGSGLGEALAKKYASEGAEICVADFNEEGGNSVVNQIQSTGGEAFFVKCDITQQWDVEKLVMTVAERWRSIDVLINNAGIASAGMLETETIEEWQRSLSETLYLELAPDDIHVAVVCPAFFDTNLNQSLQSSDPKMQAVVTKLIKKSGITADDIATKVFDAVNKKKFLIVTHKSGRQAHLLKRFLPIERYLKVVKKRTALFIKQADD